MSKNNSKKTSKAKGFLSGLGSVLEAAANNYNAAHTVATREFTFDEVTGTINMIETMENGRRQLRTFVESNSTTGHRVARECSSYTPVDACEDRNCFWHKSEPASKRPRLI